MYQYNLKYGRIDTFFLYYSNLKDYFQNANIALADVETFLSRCIAVPSLDIYVKHAEFASFDDIKPDGISFKLH